MLRKTSYLWFLLIVVVVVDCTASPDDSLRPAGVYYWLGCGASKESIVNQKSCLVESSGKSASAFYQSAKTDVGSCRAQGNKVAIWAEITEGSTPINKADIKNWVNASKEVTGFLKTSSLSSEEIDASIYKIIEASAFIN